MIYIWAREFDNSDLMGYRVSNYNPKSSSEPLEPSPLGCLLLDDLVPIPSHQTIAPSVPKPLSFQNDRSVNIPSTFFWQELGPEHRDKETS